MTITHEEHQARLNLEGALETTRAMLAEIESAYVSGTSFELHKHSSNSWVANYSVRVEGHKRWRNIGGIGNTAVEAVQEARSNLFDFAKTHKLMYGAAETINQILTEL